MSSEEDSRGSMHSDIRMIVVFAGGPAIGLALAYGASKIMDPVLIWGGMKCDPVMNSDMLACGGYAPFGVFLALFVGMVVAILSVDLFERLASRAAR